MNSIIHISADAIDVDELMQSIATDKDGALSLFIGRVRNHADGHGVSGLEYSSYPEMAEKKMRDIYDEAVEKYQTPRIAMVHRVGKLAIGTIVVAVIVASEHRRNGLDATSYIIERIKDEVPIWKRESYIDQDSSWVAAHNTDWEEQDTK